MNVRTLCAASLLFIFVAGAVACTKSSSTTDEAIVVTQPVESTEDEVASSQPALPVAQEQEAELAPGPRLSQLFADDGTIYYVAGDHSVVLSAGNLWLTEGAATKGKERKVLFDMDARKKDCISGAEGGPASGEYSGDVDVLFVTEQMIGYKLDVGGDCGGARMTWTHDFNTLDLGTMERASLLDISTEEDIMRALDAHPAIKTMREDDGCAEAPESADISGFAITRIDHGDVEVAIAFPGTYGACGPSLQVVTLSLPVRSIEVRKALTAAQDAGLLAGKLAPKKLKSVSYDD